MIFFLYNSNVGGLIVGPSSPKSGNLGANIGSGLTPPALASRKIPYKIVLIAVPLVKCQFKCYLVSCLVSPEW